jgi:hypothetical protein
VGSLSIKVEDKAEVIILFKTNYYIMRMFGENTCCPCQVPLWVGALFIGLIEFGMAMDLSMLGFEYGGLLAFNSVWFALLFVPALFYNPNYRKAVLIVFAITTIINIIMGLWLVIMGLVAGLDLGQMLSDYMEYGYDCQSDLEKYRDELDCERYAVALYNEAKADPESDWSKAQAQATEAVEEAASDIVIPACEGDLCDLLEMEEYDNKYYYAMAQQGENPEMRLAGDRRAWRWIYDYVLQAYDWGLAKDQQYKCGDGITEEIPEDLWRGIFTTAGKAQSTAFSLTYPLLEDKGKGGRRLFLDLELPEIEIPGLEIPGLGSSGSMWQCQHLCMVYWMLTVEWWISAIFLRAFFTMVLMKFQKETTSADEAHPCRPLCCSKA